MSNIDSYFIDLMEKAISDIKNGKSDVVQLDVNIDYNNVMSIKVGIYKRGEE